MRNGHKEQTKITHKRYDDIKYKWSKYKPSKILIPHHTFKHFQGRATDTISEHNRKEKSTKLKVPSLHENPNTALPVARQQVSEIEIRRLAASEKLPFDTPRNFAWARAEEKNLTSEKLF